LVFVTFPQSPLLGKDLLCKGKDLLCKGKDLLCKGKDLLCKGKDLLCKGKDLLCKGKDLVARNRDNVSKWSDISSHGLLIRLTITIIVRCCIYLTTYDWIKSFLRITIDTDPYMQI
jgi:hypothetical protein